MSLLVLSTHPIQYQAPVYRALQTQFDIPTTVIYGSDFSVAGYQDREFGVEFAWDTDLLSGYNAVFLSRVAEGGAADDRSVSARGIEQAIRDANPSAILVQGYRPRFDMRAFWAARRTGVPLLFRAETSDVARSRSRIKHILRDGFLRWFYSQFARLLYIGENSRAHYERLGCPPEKLVFSPYCVDTTPFRLTEDDRASLRLATRQELAIGSEKIVLLFVGKLAHRKGPDLLVQAVKGLPAALRALLDEVDRIVVLCQWTKALLARNNVPQAKITHSPHGLMAVSDTLGPQLPMAFSADSPLCITYLGRLDPTKGVDVLIKAVRAIPTAPIKLDLFGIVHTGQERYKQWLTDLTAGDPRIRFRDHVSYEEIIPLLKRYHILAVPSQWLETGPLVVLEAFAAKIPVIGSDLGGIAELVSHEINGLLVAPNRVEGWTRAIQRLLDTPGLLTRLQAGIAPPRSMHDVALDMRRVYRKSWG